MKISFHFNADHPSLSAYYGYDIEKLLFGLLLKRRGLNISSKVLIGDLLLSNLAYEMDGNAQNFDLEKYIEIVKQWLQPDNFTWSGIIGSRLQEALDKNIFAICFETMDLQLANDLHNELSGVEYYLGALEVDESSPIHWYLYSNYIGPIYRFINKSATVFWDGISEETQDASLINRLLKFGFQKVEFESLNGKYTIFDEYHDFEHARRIAEWKRQSGSLLAFISDDIAHRLGDTAPDLGDKLWSMLKAFNEAETNEQFALVTASCRRIVEYVSDQLFPSVEGEIEGRKLGTAQYRNRLLAFVDKTRKSDTNIDVVWISTKTLSEQMEKLSELANKGIHSEVYRTETRRCLLRTIILLDDIISLKAGAFEIKPKLNFDEFLERMKKRPKE